MNIPVEVKNKVKDSFGFSEAANKNSFLVGASVAFAKSEAYFNEEIQRLTSQVELYKNAFLTAEKDMKAVVEIFNKYNRQE